MFTGHCAKSNMNFSFKKVFDIVEDLDTDSRHIRAKPIYLYKNAKAHCNLMINEMNKVK